MRNPITFIALFCFSWHALAQETTETESTPVQQPVPAADPVQTQADLMLAYKKEHAFLSNQVSNIQQRISQFKQNAQIEKRELESSISQLERLLLNAEATANQLEDEVFQIQRNAESAEDNQGLLDATITQAQSTMTEYGFAGFAKTDNNTELDQVKTLVSLTNDTIARQATITQQQGQYFLADGTSVQGQLLKIGNIATYGSSPQGGGVLAPAGEQQFKVWKDSDTAAAEGVFKGQTSGLLPIFLYESTIKAIEEKTGKTVLSVIDSGGLIAWIITGLGLFALLLIILRFWFLKQASASTEKLLNGVVNKIERKDLQGAIALAQSKSSSSSRVLQAALRNLNRDRDHIEDIVSESILHESSQLNRFGSLILVIATVAPLLGLLGTVTGMISTFDIITQFGTGDPKLLSSGISIALVTTEVGLAVAIPTLLFGNILSGWAERIKDDMEKAALRAINVYQKVMG